MPLGTETVLITENEDAIRKLLADFLGPLGYRMITAHSVVEALKIAKKAVGIDLYADGCHHGGMGGEELAQKIQSINPGIRMFFMSDYTEKVITRQGLE